MNLRGFVALTAQKYAHDCLMATFEISVTSCSNIYFALWRLSEKVESFGTGANQTVGVASHRPWCSSVWFCQKAMEKVKFIKCFRKLRKEHFKWLPLSWHRKPVTYQFWPHSALTQFYTSKVTEVLSTLFFPFLQTEIKSSNKLTCDQAITSSPRWDVTTSVFSRNKEKVNY